MNAGEHRTVTSHENEVSSSDWKRYQPCPSPTHEFGARMHEKTSGADLIELAIHRQDGRDRKQPGNGSPRLYIRAKISPRVLRDVSDPPDLSHPACRAGPLHTLLQGCRGTAPGAGLAADTVSGPQSGPRAGHAAHGSRDCRDPQCTPAPVRDRPDLHRAHCDVPSPGVRDP